jgi:phage baseplate assembly protein W
MRAPRYRAWRFVHPDLDAVGPAPAGLRLSASGGISLVQEEASVRQALLLLLSTLPGERVMRPDYGCELYRLAFSPNDDTTAGLAIHYVRRALERWEPRVELLHLDAQRVPEAPSRLEISLDYRVRSTQRSDRVRFGLELEGGPL